MLETIALEKGLIIVGKKERFSKAKIFREM